ncbi:MAG: hypothetical protein WCK09_08805 [Bacteroidota bacterium]
MKKLLLFIIVSVMTTGTMGQVAISTDGSSPDGSAMLDVKSAVKGLLIPRMPEAQRSAISLPATGLLVYQTDGASGFYFFNGTAWLWLGGSNLTGSGANGLVTFWTNTGSLGSNANLFWDNSNSRLGIGTTSPAFQLDISGSMRLPVTQSAASGVIYMGNNRFMHNFAPIGSLGHNTFLGELAGNFTMTGLQNISSENTGIGYSSLSLNETGYFNTGTGFSTLSTNLDGNYNTAMGHKALFSNSSGNSNTAIGMGAMSSNTTGGYNTASGEYALTANTTGYQNVAQGSQSLFKSTTASRNTAIGSEALFNQSFSNGGITWNSDNVAVGYRALYSTQPSSASNGIKNTAVGSEALTVNVTGYNNTALGNNANVSLNNLTNVTVIGYNAIAGSSNEVRLGNSSVTSLFCQGAYVATTPLLPNLMADANGQIRRSTAIVPAGAGAANKVAIWTDGSTLGSNTNLHWDNTNSSLGIGTSNPGQKLTVNGTFGILEGGLSPRDHTIFQGGTQSADITYTLPVDNGSTGEVLTTDGTGILSWSPAESPLTFSNGIARIGNVVKLGGSFTENTSLEQNNAETFSINNTGTGKTAINLSSTGDFQIEDNGTAFFTATDGGNIGIGTSNPGQKLTVDGSIGILEGGGSPTHHITFSGSSQSTDLAFTLPGDIGIYGDVLTTNGLGGMYWHEVETPLTFSNGLSRIGSEVKLSGSLTENTYLVQSASSTFLINNMGTGKTAINLNSTGNFQIEDNSVPFFTATNTARIGIGTTNPGQKLTVAGTIETTSGGVKFPDGTTQTTAADNIHVVGEYYGGGIVFYVYDGGRHGLIIAPVPVGEPVQLRWYAGTNTHTMALGDGVGAGMANTAIIIANQGYGDGATYAARYCNEFTNTVNGVVYGDWYLPSKHELNLFQESLASPFNAGYHWSSTEDSQTGAWRQYIGAGQGAQSAVSKNLSYYIRPIRSF